MKSPDFILLRSGILRKYFFQDFIKRIVENLLFCNKKEKENENEKYTPKNFFSAAYGGLQQKQTQIFYMTLFHPHIIYEYIWYAYKSLPICSHFYRFSNKNIICTSHKIDMKIDIKNILSYYNNGYWNIKQTQTNP